MAEIEVSILCVTFNHVNYIKDALDGFLRQKTDFAYEILVHDDVSTDGTVDILKEYQQKYPEKIRLILEEENQYSKGVDITKDIMLPYVRGKYTAYCEGDDYWLYEGKLQRQYDLMEAHPEISLCYHNAVLHDETKDEMTLNVIGQESGYLTDSDIICPDKGWYPTSSCFSRTEYLAEKSNFHAPTGDENGRYYMASRGKIYFMNQAWSIYRWFSKGAWNTKYYEDKVIAEKYNRDLVHFLRNFNEYSDRKYEKYFYKRIRHTFLHYLETFFGEEYTLEEFSTYIQELKSSTGHMIDELLDRFYHIEAIRCSDYLQTTVKQKICKIVTSNTPVYIYSTGNDALKAIALLLKENIEVKGLITTNRVPYEEKLLEYPIYGIDDVECEKDAIIWVCLWWRYNEIKMLQDRGFKNIIY
ncbi:MAG: glycosyltransferase family 2 protein [Lachnospiraceae bacterium]|nr:glycosyltransferase family 2 protein [Lachnospiraceae bacterium]